MKSLVLLFIAALMAFCQEIPVEIAQTPAPNAQTKIFHYTSGNPDYICTAKSTQNVATITVSAISNANPGVMTATGHGFYYSATATQKIVAFISGLTGNWTPLNGIQVLTPSSANALTTAVNTTTFGAVTGTINVQTRAPNTTAKVWSLQAIGYDASNNPLLQMWAVPTTQPNGSAITDPSQLQGGTSAPQFACSAPLAYE